MVPVGIFGQLDLHSINYPLTRNGIYTEVTLFRASIPLFFFRPILIVFPLIFVIQDRQARIENLLLTLTRGMRNDGVTSRNGSL